MPTPNELPLHRNANGNAGNPAVPQITTNRPLSSSLHSSFGFRRRSDLALAIIGVFIVILCVLHVALHSGNLPRHTLKIMTPTCVGLNNCTDSGGGRTAKHLTSGEKSALQLKLDEFVKARARGDEMKFLEKKTTMSQSEIEARARQQQHEQRWQQEQEQLQKQLREKQQQPPPPPPPPEQQLQQQQQIGQKSHPVAHLNCADHGGPIDPKIVDEMIFWSDIPRDSSYLSPMHPLRDPNTPDDVERYLTFEPDHGGWNNVRMAMETALVMSHAMGRTLVLPPEQRMYLLDHKDTLGFGDFYHLDAISVEHRGFKVITIDEYLNTTGKGGELFNPVSGTYNVEGLWNYLRAAGNTPEWDPWECALAIPRSTDPGSISELKDTLRSIMDGSFGKPKPTLEEFNGNPTPVNASVAERMREMLADRDNLCIYDEKMQRSELIHLKVQYEPKEVRLLTHFYGKRIMNRECIWFIMLLLTDRVYTKLRIA
jgi:hypothetical protein